MDSFLIREHNSWVCSTKTIFFVSIYLSFSSLLVSCTALPFFCLTFLTSEISELFGSFLKFFVSIFGKCRSFEGRVMLKVGQNKNYIIALRFR